MKNLENRWDLLFMGSMKIEILIEPKALKRKRQYHENNGQNHQRNTQISVILLAQISYTLALACFASR